MFPVAQRELLVISRRRSTSLLRLIPGGICILVWLSVFVFWAAPQAGLNGFYALSALAFTYCMLAGFFFTADSVSTERREGTLPLLFHARTTVADVVLGKYLGTALSPVYGLLTILPFFAVPILDGGVTLAWAARTSLALLVTLLFSLAAGLVASVVGGDDDGAYIGTALFIAAPTVPFGIGFGVLFLWCIRRVGIEAGKRWAFVALVAAAMAVSGWAIWASSEWFVGVPFTAWQGALKPTAAEYWPAVVQLAAFAVIYVATATLLIDPHAREVGRSGEEGKRRANAGLSHRGMDQADAIGLFLARHARGAILFVYVATVIELISGAITAWAVYRNAPAAGVVFFGNGQLPGMLVAFTISRLAVVAFATLKENRTFEVLVSTPLKFSDLLDGARRVFWRTARWSLVVVLLVLLGSFAANVSRMPQFEWQFLISSLVHGLMYIPYYAALFWMGSYFGLRLRKAGAATLLTLAIGLFLPTLAMMVCQLFFGKVMILLLNTPGLLTWAPTLIFQLALNWAPHLAVYLGLIYWARKKLLAMDLRAELNRS